MDEKKYVQENDLEKVNGGAMGDGKYGGDGGYDDYFWYHCPICGSNHFFVEDLQPEKVYRDGTVQSSGHRIKCNPAGRVLYKRYKLPG